MPLLLTCRSSSREETLEMGAALGAWLAERGLAGGPGGTGASVLGLVGELGTGKTTMTKGLARGLGVRELHRVSSPTFVLRQEYRARVPLRHYDGYRLSGVEELLSLGFEEDLGSGGVVVVEWADRVLPALPREALLIELEHESGSPDSPPPLPGTLPPDPGLRRIAFRGDPALWEEGVRRALKPG